VRAPRIFRASLSAPLLRCHGSKPFRSGLARQISKSHGGGATPGKAGSFSPESAGAWFASERPRRSGKNGAGEAKPRRLIMPKRKTNEQFVASIMTFSRRGALIQPFVIAALEHYAKEVVEAHKNGELQGGSFALISPDAWADCGREILEKMEHNGYITK
jgi:hypothetical protein